MNLRYIILFLLAATTASAQYVGPTPRTMRYRIYGEGARPISEKDGYSVSVEATSVEGYYEGVVKSAEFDGSDVLLHTLAEWDQFHGWLVVVRGRDTMRIKSPIDLDSVPFRKGALVVPSEYRPLFQTKPAPGIGFLPTIDQFFVDSITAEPDLHEITCTRMRYLSAFDQPRSYNSGRRYFRQVAVLPTSRHLIALAQTNRQPRSVIYRSADRGATWVDIKYPLGGQLLQTIAVDDDENWWIWQTDTLTNRNIISRTTDGGRSWNEVPSITPELTRRLSGRSNDLFVVSDRLRFRFTLMKAGGGHELIRSTDGGATWRTLFERKSWHTATLDFLDEKFGIMASDEHLFLTFDAGNSWRFIPYDFSYLLENKVPARCEFARMTRIEIIDKTSYVHYGEDGIAVIDWVAVAKKGLQLRQEDR